jgi:hypothetical protein
MNPNPNSMITREPPPPPPIRPNSSSNAFGGNSTALPAPIVPQYVIIRYSLLLLVFVSQIELNILSIYKFQSNTLPTKNIFSAINWSTK